MKLLNYYILPGLLFLALLPGCKSDADLDDQITKKHGQEVNSSDDAPGEDDQD
jgi:hypothetical protein